jgi:hypothetical protein
VTAETAGAKRATKRDQPDQACGLRKVGLFAQLAVDLLQASQRSSRHIARLLGIGIGAVLRVLVYHREPMVQPESSAAVTLPVIDPWADFSVRLDPISTEAGESERWACRGVWVPIVGGAEER